MVLGGFHLPYALREWPATAIDADGCRHGAGKHHAADALLLPGDRQLLSVAKRGQPAAGPAASLSEDAASFMSAQKCRYTTAAAIAKMARQPAPAKAAAAGARPLPVPVRAGAAVARGGLLGGIFVPQRGTAGSASTPSGSHAAARQGAVLPVQTGARAGGVALGQDGAEPDWKRSAGWGGGTHVIPAARPSRVSAPGGDGSAPDDENEFVVLEEDDCFRRAAGKAAPAAPPNAANARAAQFIKDRGAPWLRMVLCLSLTQSRWVRRHAVLQSFGCDALSCFFLRGAHLTPRACTAVSQSVSSASRANTERGDGGCSAGGLSVLDPNATRVVPAPARMEAAAARLAAQRPAGTPDRVGSQCPILPAK
jgi:hypothetical protein